MAYGDQVLVFLNVHTHSASGNADDNRRVKMEDVLAALASYINHTEVEDSECIKEDVDSIINAEFRMDDVHVNIILGTTEDLAKFSSALHALERISDLQKFSAQLAKKAQDSGLIDNNDDGDAANNDTSADTSIGDEITQEFLRKFLRGRRGKSQ